MFVGGGDGYPYRMWYRPFESGVALALSRDGIRWRKPRLSLVRNVTVVHSWTNEKELLVPPESNVLPVGMELSLGEHPSVEPFYDARGRPGGYMAGVYCLHSAKEERWTDVCAIRSRDGLKWRPYRVGASPSSPGPLQQEAGAGPAPEFPQGVSKVGTALPVRGQDALLAGPADSYVHLMDAGPANPVNVGGLLLTTRRNFAHWEPRFRWRGTRGLRVLRHHGAADGMGAVGAREREAREDPTTGWELLREYSLDMQYGPVEHLRRQIYSLTVTKITRQDRGLCLGIFAVLEWPKDGAALPDADQVAMNDPVLSPLPLVPSSHACLCYFWKRSPSGSHLRRNKSQRCRL